jgi:transcription elongation factor Elf1
VRSTILVTRTFECRWCPASRTGQARVEIHDAHAMLHACADCEAQGFTATRIRRTDADHYIPWRSARRSATGTGW